MPPQEQTGGTPTLAQAMEEVARAEVRAEAARARAQQLSRKAAADTEDVDDGAGEVQPTSPRRARLRRRVLRRPGRKSLAVAAAVALICAGLGTTGYVVWYHRKTVDERQRAAEFAAVARQDAITLMSIDATKARDDVQRIIDQSTGSYKNGMLLNASDLVEAAEKSKVSTKATVQAVAVETMTNDSAVVLVSAKAEATTPDNTKSPPRLWRIVMTLQRDGGQLKMSRVEFLP